MTLKTEYAATVALTPVFGPGQVLKGFVLVIHNVANNDLYSVQIDSDEFATMMIGRTVPVTLHA